KMAHASARIQESARIKPILAGSPDDVFICCASFEERCLGSLTRFDNYSFRHGYVFAYGEPSEARERNLIKMKELMSGAGPFKLLSTSESEPLLAVSQLGLELSEQARDCKINSV